MDRSILEGNPHSVIEGMLIGAFGTGATEGVVYVRAEYPLAIKHLMIALRQARELGLLGEDILGTGFSFDISMVQGRRRLRLRRGDRADPLHRGQDGRARASGRPSPWSAASTASPPASTTSRPGPTSRVIIDQGARPVRRGGHREEHRAPRSSAWWARSGTPAWWRCPWASPSTRSSTTSAAGRRRARRSRPCRRAAPPAAASPPSMFDLPIDYDSLAEAGSIMGSGGMIVMDEHTCMVDVAKYFMDFLKDESCGKCFTCRKGTQRMYEILDDITAGEGTLDQLDLLEELATRGQGHHHVRPGPVGAPTRCSARCATSATSTSGTSSTSAATRSSARSWSARPASRPAPSAPRPGATWPTSPAASTRRPTTPSGSTNPFPSVCARVCDHKCEAHCRLGTTGTDPVAIRALKRFVTDRIRPSRYAPARRDDGKNAAQEGGRGGIRAGRPHRGPLPVAEGLQRHGLRGRRRARRDAASRACPQYRLPRDVLQKEIDALIDDNITLRVRARPWVGTSPWISLFERGLQGGLPGPRRSPQPPAGHRGRGRRRVSTPR